MTKTVAVTTSIDITQHMTVADTAASLGVSERTVWRYLKSGRLNGETIGEIGSQRTLIDPESVESLRTERSSGPEVDALRAERDRLSAELATTQAERDALAARVRYLQQAVAHRRSPVGGFVDKVTGAMTRVGIASPDGRRAA